MSIYERLYFKWLWLRHSYTFHFAHKPLCQRHRQNVVRIGRVHLCRSCLCVFAGVAGGAIAIVAGAGERALLATSIVALPLVVGLSVPPLYGGLPRLARDVVRLATGALVTVGVWVAIVHSLLIGAGALAVLAISYLPYARMRAGLKADSCKGCAESLSGGVCSGYAMQSGHVREYRRELGEFLASVDRTSDGDRQRRAS